MIFAYTDSCYRRGDNPPRKSHRPEWAQDRDRRMGTVPVNRSFDRNAEQSKPKDKEPYVPTSSRFMSKSKAREESSQKRFRPAPITTRTEQNHSHARPLATPALNGPGSPVHYQPPMSQAFRVPMPMQDPTRSYQQWYSEHTAMQPYGASPYTPTQGIDLYEKSNEYEHARPVAFPFNGHAQSHPYHGHSSRSTALSPAAESSYPGIGVADPEFQPSDNVHHLRIAASDFVPGVREHNF